MRLSPSALNDFLACRYLTWLEGEREEGRIELREIPRPDAELVRLRGLEHEREFRDALVKDGRSLTEIVGDRFGARRDATLRAMEHGAEVIYQAAFADAAGWTGYADFLIRIEEPSALGGHSYEAYDTKLAKHPKPYFVLQLAFYTEQIGAVQRRTPEHMHVVLGDRSTESLRYQDFAAYVRRIRADFESSLEAHADPPYPWPVAHCDWCRWWRHCVDKRRDDDHLSRVADLGRSQGVKLEAAGVVTMRGLGSLPDSSTVDRLAPNTLESLRLQARLQVHTEDTGEHVREFLPIEDGRGFLRLPAPSPADLFFDLEGDPYWGAEGLEYLFGTTDSDGDYQAIWAHDEEAERAALAEWVASVMDRLSSHPDMHVYHYNHYEPTALQRLMGRYGTCEAEIDELLQREVFVDLFPIVRQALRAGEPGYSLKDLEAFYGFERDAEVTEAGGSILAYQEWLESREEGKLEAIAEYNADDCRSTKALRDWLVVEAAEAQRQFGVVLPSRDAKPKRERSAKSKQRLEDLNELRGRLSPDAGLAPDAYRARRLLAELLDYHQRENKPAWWAYFARTYMTPSEIGRDDPEAIGDLVPASDLEVREEKQSFVYPLRFPAQQHKIRPGRAIDPSNERTLNVHELDDAEGVVWLKRSKKLHGEPLPEAIGPGQPLDRTDHNNALRRLARRVIEHGDEPRGEYDAALDLLLRRRPRRARDDGREFALATLSDDVASLTESYLFVQGPPGTGKTHTGAQVIVDLLEARERVGVAATSHKAIHNLLAAVEAEAKKRGATFSGLKKGSADAPDSIYEGEFVTTSTTNADFPPSDDVLLVAGTSWLFARETMERSVTTLVIDEAGQMSLADAIAIAQSAANLVLLGDPQQLAHVSQGRHPERSGVSILQHLLGERDTVASDSGLFLEKTWRMHPDVCSFISNVMYEGRLSSMEHCADRRIDADAVGLSGSGLRFVPVDHEGNQQTSVEEAAATAAIVSKLLEHGRLVAGVRVRPMTLDDVLVVAPFNAQVRTLQQALPAGARVGTVDKFQGQEAPVVIFSMTSSTGEDVPRGMDFLFSRNRLNVAVSRAQCLAAVVCSARLLGARCNTVDQMRLVNAVCRFAEIAEQQEDAADNRRLKSS